MDLMAFMRSVTARVDGSTSGQEFDQVFEETRRAFLEAMPDGVHGPPPDPPGARAEKERAGRHRRRRRAIESGSIGNSDRAARDLKAADSVGGMGALQFAVVSGQLDWARHLRAGCLGGKLCGWCGRQAKNLKKCAGCARIRYCSAECQRLHWRDPEGHKLSCTPISTDAAEPE